MLSISVCSFAAFQLIGSKSFSVPHCRAEPRMNAPLRFEVCQNKYCKKKGSAATLQLMQEMAEGREDIIVEAADMSHTEHGCFDECTSANMRIEPVCSMLDCLSMLFLHSPKLFARWPLCAAVGPNVRVGGDGPRTDSLPFGAGKVVNGIKGEEAIEKLLATPP